MEFDLGFCGSYLEVNRDMKDKKKIVCRVVVFLSLLCALIVPSKLVTAHYDISYFWAKNVGAARAYAFEVEKALRAKGRERIGIVHSRAGCYGVIYDLDGSRESSVRLAQEHAALLYQAGVTKLRGLDAACPVRDRGYVTLQKPFEATLKKTSSSASSIDSRLEEDIDRYIKGLRRREHLSKTDRTSFVIYDIARAHKLVSINEDRPMMAASLIKNFVMLAYFHEVRQDRLSHTNQNRRHLRNMIQKSFNSSTNYFIRLLGGPRRVNRILTANYPYFEHTRIVEYIPNGGRTYRNTTSSHDMNRFYNQLWLGNLPLSIKMKYYLGLPKADRLFDNTCIPQGVHVYNKTGTVYGMVADSGVVVITDPSGKRRAYIVTGIIEDRTKINQRNRSLPFTTWVNRRSEILRSVSEGVYEYIYERNYGGVHRCRQHRGRHLASRA